MTTANHSSNTSIRGEEIERKQKAVRSAERCNCRAEAREALGGRRGWRFLGSRPGDPHLLTNPSSLWQTIKQTIKQLLLPTLAK